ncbi:OmpA family protein [Sinomonas humi]|uniref:OmpA family protein n=1 Tax=Sinomonas humi TaxID=1338436 RepID=UPI00068D6BC0|nr:OmpA family protein [Sinomonas humi]
MTPLPGRPRRLRAAAALAIALAGAVLTGCSAPAPAPAGQAQDCTPAPDSLAIVVAVHADAAPGIPAEAGCLIEAALEHNAPISIVAEDGAPYSVQTRRTYGITPGSDTYDLDMDNARAALIKAVSTAAARTDGDDTLAALNLAAQLTAGAKNPAIIVDSPGLPDTTPLDLTDPALAAAAPADVTATLAAHHYIPAMTGTRILWAGLGAAAGKQAPLPAPQAANYRAIWESILAKAGATAQIVPGSASGTTAPNADGHTVHPVPPIQTHIDFPADGGTAVYPDTSPLGFQPGTTDLRDPAGAQSTAAALAAWLAADPHRTLQITGTTADDGSTQYQHDLAQQRAQAIAALIAGHGIDPARITATGAGHDFPGYTPDHNPDGTLDPAKAATNRTVRITLNP